MIAAFTFANTSSQSLNLSSKEIKDRIAELHEENPMLGHRGCRLGISFPEIYEMQCEAIFKALVELKKEKTKAAKTTRLSIRSNLPLQSF